MDAVQNAPFCFVTYSVQSAKLISSQSGGERISVFIHLDIIYPSRLSLRWCHEDKKCQVQIQQKWKQMFCSSKSSWISISRMEKRREPPKTLTAQPLFEIMTDTVSQFHNIYYLYTLCYIVFCSYGTRNQYTVPIYYQFIFSILLYVYCTSVSVSNK